MPITYIPLWNKLSELDIQPDQFASQVNISTSTFQRMKRNEEVSISTLNKIRKNLDCEFNEIFESTDKKSPLYYKEYSPKYNTKTELNTISLFSGCGGLDLGLKQAGFNLVFANDNYFPAIENYSYNVGEISNTSIENLDSSMIPDGDILVGGFPCQPFSSAGNRLGTEDERGNLYLDMLKIIEEKNPKIVIMENVRGLLSMKNKDGSKLIDTIVELLSNCGDKYNVTYKLLKASDYGVPQNRYRIFIVGIRKDLDFHFVFPQPFAIEDKSLTVSNIINVPDNVPNANDIWPLSPQSQNLVQHIPEGGSWKNVPYENLPERLKKIRDNMKKYRSPNFYRRFSRDEINGTITAAATPENSGILHPLEDRRYSVREISRIQSFPDDYIFVGSSVPSMYKVIGNAVPPTLAKVVGEALIEQLHFYNL